LKSFYLAYPNLCYFAVGVIAELTMMQISSASAVASFSKHMNALPALPDRIHDSALGVCDQSGGGINCPSWARPLTDALPDKLMTLNLAALAALIFSAGWRNQKEWWRSLRIVTEVMLLQSFLMVLRSSTIWVTTVPAPSPLCRNSTADTLPQKGWFLTLIGCNDAIFSGHTVLYSITLMIFLTSHLPKVVKMLWIFYFFVCALASCATHDHYTIDVLVAIYISIPVAGYRRDELIRLFGKDAKFM